VIGVALLMGIAVVSMAALTAGIGAVVEENAASADASRVAGDFATALQPVGTTGRHTGNVRFSAGRLRTIERDLRVRNASGATWEVETGGLVFEAGDRRVAAVAGGIVRGSGANSWLVESPPLTASRDGEVLIVGAPRLNASDVTVSGSESTVTLRSRVTHERVALGNGTYSVAIETETPGAFARWFREQNATVTRRDVDGDGVPSVVAQFPGDREGYLVVHDMHLEVNGG
jgi:hypothetical protein